MMKVISIKKRMEEEILGIIRKEGLLLDKEIYDLLDSFDDVGIARELLGKLQMFSGEKFITKKSLIQNYSSIKGFVGGLPGQNEKSIEKIFINLGLSLEITREMENNPEASEVLEGNKVRKDFQVHYSNLFSEKKLEVKDFVGLFRSRYQQLQKILMQRGELQKNLISINKISSDRSSVGIIGILTEKKCY